MLGLMRTKSILALFLWARLSLTYAETTDPYAFEAKYVGKYRVKKDIILDYFVPQTKGKPLAKHVELKTGELIENIKYLGGRICRIRIRKETFGDTCIKPSDAIERVPEGKS